MSNFYHLTRDLMFIDCEDCKNDKTSLIKIELVDESPFHLKGSFPGPDGTPYEGGKFEVVSWLILGELQPLNYSFYTQDIVIPESYPFQPVKMKFITKLYHPNVSSASGAICLDILKDAWSPVLTLKSTLISLQSLLCSPEPNDPQDAEVAKHYMTSKQSFEETAAYWTHIYADGPPPKGSGGAANDEVAIAGLDKTQVDRFEALGFQRSKVVCSLSNDLCFHLEQLFSLGRCLAASKLSWCQHREDIG